MGCALQQGSAGFNTARQAGLKAGLPESVAGQTIDRQCSSGLMAIATAAKQIIVDGMEVTVGGGVESISLVQNRHMNNFRSADPQLLEETPGLYIPMIETAELVAERYGVSREAQDEYALQSQQRTAQAQEEGRFDLEIVPMTVTMKLTNKETGETTDQEITLSKDEGNRPSTTLESLQKLGPVWKSGSYVKEGKYVTAGNASQLSDGAAAVVMMCREEADRRGATPLGAYRGMAVAGCAPEEMGIGPVFAVPKLLKQAGLTRRRHRDLGAERGLRQPGPLLPRHPRHPQRPAQRLRRRHLHRPSLRHDRRPLHRPRAPRGQAPRGEVRGGHHVRRRRHGRCGLVRDLLMSDFNTSIIEEFRANEGRVGGPFEGANMLLLHTTGAKSGQERIAPLVYQPQDDGTMAVFGSRGGAPTHPDWYRNLVANPDVTVEVGTETRELRARVATGGERERIWSKQKELAPGFAEYEKTAGDREIPVILLESR